MKNNNTAIFENSARRTLHFAVTSGWPGTSDSRRHEFMTPSRVVPVHGSLSRISKTSHQKLKREVSRMEKRFKIAIMFSGRRRRSREERNGFVKADVIK